MLFIVLSMGCIVWLFGERNAYKTKIKEMQIKEAELIDHFFDLQQEYEKCWNELYKAEELKTDTLLKGFYPIP